MPTEFITRRAVADDGEVLEETAGERRLLKFGDLSERAQDRAYQEWANRGYEDPDILDCTIDAVVEVLEILGVAFDTREIRLYGGGTRKGPVLSYSIGGGDNRFTFSGTWSYNGKARRTLRASFPKDRALNDIADRLGALGRKHRGGVRCRLDAKPWTHRIRLGWTEYVTRAGVTHEELPPADYDELESCVTEMQDWAADYLQCELDFQTSRERFVEDCSDLEYLFDEDGDRG